MAQRRAEFSSTWVDMIGTPPVPSYAYAYIEGTSMACPHVAGAAALLLSHGVPANEVKSRLATNARPPVNGMMDPTKYGAGVLDLYAALTNVSLKIIKPAKGSTVTNSPEVKISVRGIDTTTLKVFSITRTTMTMASRTT